MTMNEQEPVLHTLRDLLEETLGTIRQVGTIRQAQYTLRDTSSMSPDRSPSLPPSLRDIYEMPDGRLLQLGCMTAEDLSMLQEYMQRATEWFALRDTRYRTAHRLGQDMIALPCHACADAVTVTRDADGRAEQVDGAGRVTCLPCLIASEFVPPRGE